MERKTVYVKLFSALNSMQLERRVEYALLEERKAGETWYGIEVQTVCGTDREMEAMPRISKNRAFVIDLITLLYENAVSSEFARDVVHNFVYQVNMTI